MNKHVVMEIMSALGEFQAYLLSNTGQPIGLSIFGAFTRLSQRIISALKAETGE